MPPDEVPLFPPRDPENLNDDSEDLFDEWLEQTGLSEYEDYPGTLYHPDWPYGAPCPDLPSCRFLTGFGDGGAASSTFANLALSLLAHGRIDASRVTIERTHELYRNNRADILRAARVYEALSEELSLEGIPLPENRQARQAIEAATSPEDSVERLRGVYTEPSMSQEDRRVVELHLGHAECQLSDDMGRHGHYRLEMFVEQEPDFVERYPIVLYVLARCHKTRYDYPLAVDAMVRYVDQATE
jgi:hypothetical protein